MTNIAALLDGEVTQVVGSEIELSGFPFNSAASRADLRSRKQGCILQWLQGFGLGYPIVQIDGISRLFRLLFRFPANLPSTTLQVSSSHRP